MEHEKTIKERKIKKFHRDYSDYQRGKPFEDAVSKKMNVADKHDLQKTQESQDAGNISSRRLPEARTTSCQREPEAQTVHSAINKYKLQPLEEKGQDNACNREDGNQNDVVSEKLDATGKNNLQGNQEIRDDVITYNTREPDPQTAHSAINNANLQSLEEKGQDSLISTDNGSLIVSASAVNAFVYFNNTECEHKFHVNVVMVNLVKDAVSKKMNVADKHDLQKNQESQDAGNISSRRLPEAQTTSIQREPEVQSAHGAINNEKLQPLEEKCQDNACNSQYDNQNDAVSMKMNVADKHDLQKNQESQDAGSISSRRLPEARTVSSQRKPESQTVHSANNNDKLQPLEEKGRNNASNGEDGNQNDVVSEKLDATDKNNLQGNQEIQDDVITCNTREPEPQTAHSAINNANLQSLEEKYQDSLIRTQNGSLIKTADANHPSKNLDAGRIQTDDVITCVTNENSNSSKSHVMEGDDIPTSTHNLKSGNKDEQKRNMNNTDEKQSTQNQVLESVNRLEDSQRDMMPPTNVTGLPSQNKKEKEVNSHVVSECSTEAVNKEPTTNEKILKTIDVSHPSNNMDASRIQIDDVITCATNESSNSSKSHVMEGDDIPTGTHNLQSGNKDEQKRNMNNTDEKTTDVSHVSKDMDSGKTLTGDVITSTTKESTDSTNSQAAEADGMLSSTCNLQSGNNDDQKRNRNNTNEVNLIFSFDLFILLKVS
ncbi:putative uncharacterized protein DDB_G0286901 [Protopterus annectens]|uniref:putative uncharacterized protein DDB_G0286901 n=1 Tax=Protopterus annectens TaxID=7888 RepID=UPI001CFA622C|nr:putative uncharacterized protein DDB_G0286901 [Protopterus annectens]